MEDNNKFFSIDMALAAIENCFSYYRPIININTGEVSSVMSKQKITKVDDDNIRIEVYFDNNLANTMVTSADIFIDAVEKANKSGVADLNSFTEIMSNFMIESFKKQYDSSYTTIRDLVENSNIVIFDEKKNPLIAMKNNNGFMDYSDVVDSPQEKLTIPYFYLDYEASKKEISDEFYSLINHQDIEDKVVNSNFIAYFYNKKYVDKIFSFYFDTGNAKDGIPMKKFDIVKDINIVEIYKNNLDKPKNLLFSLSDAFRQKTKKLSLFANQMRR